MTDDAPRGHWQVVYQDDEPVRMAWVWDVEPSDEWFERELERRQERGA